MRRSHHFALCLPLVLCVGAHGIASDSPSLAKLRTKGLSKSGRYLVIGDEEVVLGRWKASRVTLASSLEVAERRRAAEQEVRNAAELESLRQELQERLNDLNQQINEQNLSTALPPSGGPGQGGLARSGFGQAAMAPPLIQQRNMIRAGLAEITAMQRAAKANANPSEDLKSLSSQGQKSQEAARSTLKELRQQVDAVHKRYAELGADSSVKAAFRSLEQEKLGGLKLGPSNEFRSMVKSLEGTERKILGSTARTARKRATSRR